MTQEHDVIVLWIHKDWTQALTLFCCFYVLSLDSVFISPFPGLQTIPGPILSFFGRLQFGPDLPAFPCTPHRLHAIQQPQWSSDSIQSDFYPCLPHPPPLEVVFLGILLLRWSVEGRGSHPPTSRVTTACHSRTLLGYKEVKPFKLCIGPFHVS